jgi:hypothetical protein
MRVISLARGPIELPQVYDLWHWLALARPWNTPSAVATLGKGERAVVAISWRGQGG